MANISLLSRLVNGVQRQVDLSTNTLVVQALKTGVNTLTDTILGRLISLQNGSDVDATFHTHNTIYYTQTQLSAHATPAASGAHLIGDGNTYTHITPAGTTVEDALLALDGAVGSAATAVDTTFRIVNFTDATKKIAFSAAGISTATTRTITMPDSDVNLGLVATAIQANGSVAFTADQSHGGFKITNLANGVNPQDAITFSQVQQLLAGLDWKQHVRAMSDSSITLSGTQTVDGVSLIAGDRILVQNQATASANGIYVVAAGAWSRSSDTNTASGLLAASVYVDEGTVYKGSAWVQTAPAPITIGTTAITFVKFASILPLIFRNGLTQTGQTIDVTPGDTSLTSAVNSLIVNLNTNGGLVTSSGIKINLNATNPGLAITTNALDVKYNPAGAIVASASGITANTDSVSLEISSNALRIKTTAYDQTSITGGGGTAASVVSSPSVQFAGIAGQAFAANTTFAVRFGLSTETVGRVYAADTATNVSDLFWVVGFIQTTTALVAGNPVIIISTGIINLKTADTAFGINDPGKAVILQVGGQNATTTPPSTAGLAVAKIGMVISISSFFAQIAAPYVY